MDSRELVIGGIYRHFKDKLYQVKCVAYHSETKEKMVVYQALYGDYSVYVRPYDMFMSAVDTVKYPNVQQKYRFEQVFPDGSDMPQNKAGAANASEADAIANEHRLSEALSDNEAQEQPEKFGAKAQKEVPEVEAAESIDPRLERFLDAKSYEEKLDILASFSNSLDDRLIDAMAVSMDVKVPEGNIDSRYISLRNCIRAHAKYEGMRLR